VRGRPHFADQQHGVLELIVKTGIARRSAKGNKKCNSETIESNVRRKIIRSVYKLTRSH
jgi:hypothetical protein